VAKILTCWGFEFRQGLGIFLFATASGSDHPSIQWYQGLFLFWAVKRQERESDHSPPSSAGIKNVWSYTSAPQCNFMAWYLVKVQGQLYICRVVNNETFQFST